MFATDRDLLTLEPGLFGLVAWTGQRLASGIGSVTGSVLTIAGQDVSLEAAGVDAGHVVLIDGCPAEVVERTGENTAVVSRLRVSTGSPVLPVGDASEVPVRVFTFAPQIADVHRRLMRMLGIEPDGDGPTEGTIMNTHDMARVEALGALHLIYAGASASGSGPGGASTIEAEKAEWYRLRFMEERARIVARLDLDGDGVADAARRANAMRSVRL